ncbi:N(4)-(beta-N-acetylglucosaminyl)-L-asparaginase [Paraliomyxa miuraensis]|uniref:N(4)-(beta-N-acetylglucosaminyl)-L-asparaginase n=1 Tax=Paraliomyxa miuraensis TaxID=376150 RepID=UPI00224FC9F4|nr:N(4)-(beta-N-acetylglucosaminyl)-L-asparaginase [Paraliomyxa miuraensis]MCX4244027.1 N(4)-(beta-N-acetylglucosaminyl)-L-asparaginase [Paraliomyxa miuraensis]
MRRRLKRRSFLVRTSAVLGTGCLATRSGRAKAPAVIDRPPHPVVVASANGYPHCTAKAMEELLAGTPVADAVVAGVSLVEDDPTDHSVGLGGLPNEEGVVELDASVMDGATGLSGAVAALQRIKNPSQVALRVMRYTDHCLLVGEGALRFARAHGFSEQELLTDEARKIWLYWKSTLSDSDDWLPTDPKELPPDAKSMFGITGTINCDAVDAKGNLAGVTTTSGLAFKIPGRVGDSPLIGAGLFVDNAVGAAGSTGRGEANIITAGSATVVEGLRQGKHPTDACLMACQRITDATRIKRLQRPDGKPDFNVKFYAVDKAGRFGGAAIYGGELAVCDGKGNRKEPMARLFEE